jgi:hypothetical protein
MCALAAAICCADDPGPAVGEVTSAGSRYLGIAPEGLGLGEGVDPDFPNTHAASAADSRSAVPIRLRSWGAGGVVGDIRRRVPEAITRRPQV